MSVDSKGRIFFTKKEKLEHYTQVASGEKKISKTSKYDKNAQINYAKGQRDARNDLRIGAFLSKKNTSVSDSQKNEFKKKQEDRRAQYKADNRDKFDLNGKYIKDPPHSAKR